MKTDVKWISGMEFSGSNALNDSLIVIDYADSSKGESGRGTTPKQMFLQSVAGCTGMDVINILTKMRSVLPDSFSMEVEGKVAEEEPAVFTNILLTYYFTGAMDDKALLRAVKLSQEKYCSISIMVKRICDFEYKIIFNGAEIYNEVTKASFIPQDDDSWHSQFC
ncbi:MAG TPA: OsmC family protein [Spirochaetota bacterium]|nr:OsmC family protein [Spirochaetota bacterium]HPS86500.1 OsmC family protein [Spirochaetota bacterium]